MRELQISHARCEGSTKRCHHRQEILMSTLSKKLALVTGGNRNIGRETALALALALARAGADVVIAYHQQADSAAATVKDLQALGVKAAALQVSLTGTAQLPAFVERFQQQLAAWGRKDFDIRVNNAGTLRIGAFDKISDDDLDAVFNTHYQSVFFLTQKLAVLMANNGRIVNLGSGTARIAFGPRGITVNAVAPGGLDDDFNAPLFAMMPAKDTIKANTAVARVGVPNDVGSVIAFLCSPQASFISGAVLPIDGG
jgi:NAD(P)-dependent dehydrogenase (short-subunit alcohol dehydrogenase family)